MISRFHFVFTCLFLCLTHVSSSAPPTKKLKSLALKDEDHTMTDVPVDGDMVAVIPLEPPATEARGQRSKNSMELTEPASFRRFQRLPRFPTNMTEVTEETEKAFSAWRFRTTVADHMIGFRFFREAGKLFVTPLLSSLTSDRISVQLVSFIDSHLREEQEPSSALKLATGPLTHEAILPLGTLEEVQAFIQSNPHVYLMFEISFVPEYIPDTRMKGLPYEIMSPQEREQVLSKVEVLLAHQKYGVIDRIIGDSTNKLELLRAIVPAVTSSDQLGGLLEHLRQRNLVRDFLILGGLELVKSVIVKFRNFGNGHFIADEFIHGAIAVTCKHGQHDRALQLLEAAKERCGEKDKTSYLITMGRTPFQTFIRDFFGNIKPEKSNIPLKSFLTFHAKNYSAHKGIFEPFGQELVCHLKDRFDTPAARKFLVDLIGQPSLIEPTTFTMRFLSYEDATDRVNLIKYAWREAIEEGLKSTYKNGDRLLWETMVDMCPSQIPTAFAFPDHAFDSSTYSDGRTKEECEQRLFKIAVASLAQRLEELSPFATETLRTIAEYAVTVFPRGYSTSENARKSALEMFSTKKELEAEWLKENERYVIRILSEFMPVVLAKVVAEYIEKITWIII